METDIQLRDMPFEAIVGIVDRWPWFGAAQKVLCEKLGRMAGRELSRRQCADAALHVASRGKVASLLRNASQCTDMDVAKLLRKYVEPEPEPELEPEAGIEVEATLNSGFRGVGDYFSREQYDALRRGGDSWVRGSDFTGNRAEAMEPARGDIEISAEDFCTEAIAGIYVEQGYFDRAKDIYAKLILKYPEKSTYFAALIEKMNIRK